MEIFSINNYVKFHECDNVLKIVHKINVGNN